MSREERQLKELKESTNKRLIDLEAQVEVLKRRQKTQQPPIIIFKGKGKNKHE